MNLQKRGLCGQIKARWDSHDTCLACTNCTLLKKCAVCDLWSYDIWTQAGRHRMSNSHKRHEPLTDVDDPVTSLVNDDQLTFQSLDTGHDGGVVCRSSSDRMTPTIHTGDIDRGPTDRSMSDQMAAAILRSLASDVTGREMTGRSAVRSGHDMTDRSSGHDTFTGPVQFGPVTGQQSEEGIDLHHRITLLPTHHRRMKLRHQGVDIGHAHLRQAILMVATRVSDHVVVHGALFQKIPVSSQPIYISTSQPIQIVTSQKTSTSTNLT
ncbi:hypothetical protein DPMN_034235 [Dreissena polymorpha]|uniref:Uncharacterized protein n=1 Tax=Dreissena polymorpha TaxID=45954 RepID=A0A9D4M7H5_DREPO|nr:hypothetical protein DPMN_034235 [Dreissena polymorpha]